MSGIRRDKQECSVRVENVWHPPSSATTARGPSAALAAAVVAPHVGAAPCLRLATTPTHGAPLTPRPPTTDARPGYDGWCADGLAALAGRTTQGPHDSARWRAASARGAGGRPRWPTTG